MEPGASKIKKFKRALIRDPNLFDANMGLALVYFRRNEFLEALPYAEKAARIDPSSAEAKALLGSIYIELGKDEKAEEYLDEARGLASDDYSVYSRLAEVRVRLNSVSGAIEVLEDALERFSHRAEAHNDLGVLYFLNGKLADAEKELNEALSIDPKNADARFNRAVVYLEQGNMSEAVKAFGALIDIEHAGAEHYRNMGFAYRGCGDADGAAETFRRALALDPRDPESHYGLGSALLELGQLDASAQSLGTCLELMPGHDDALLALLVCLAKKGETQKIVEVWEGSADRLARQRKTARRSRMRFSRAKELASSEKIEMTERRVAQLVEERMEISVIVPVLDDAESVRAFHERLDQVLERIGKKYEAIYVDAGSHDGTLDLLRELNSMDERARTISLVRGCSRAAVLSAGLDHARGSVIVTLSDDLQDDPEDIPKLLDKIAEGYDMVAGSRNEREDLPPITKMKSRMVTWIVGKLLGLNLRDCECGMRAYRKEVVDSIGWRNGAYWCAPAVAGRRGLSTAEVLVTSNRDGGARTGRRAVDPMGAVLDGIVAKSVGSETAEAVRCFGKLGLCSIGFGVIVAVLVALGTLLARRGVAWRAIAFGMAFFVLMAMMLVTAGLVIEISVRAQHQSRGKPHYVVKEIIE